MPSEQQAKRVEGCNRVYSSAAALSRRLLVDEPQLVMLKPR